MLIKCFGEYWNVATVDWSAKSLKGEGKIDGTKYSIEFWNARGVYVLYNDFKPVYVGKSDSAIGDRLAAHLTDRFAGRWDMFSWFCVNKPNKTDGGVNDPQYRQVDLSDAIATFESILIVAMAPPLNRKYESLPDAIPFEQVGAVPHKTFRQYFEELISLVKN